MSDATRRTDDPYEEPENSTVDDWLGQSVERDRDLAEHLVDEEGGDEAAAERRFQQEAHGAEEQRQRLHPEIESLPPDVTSPGETFLQEDLPQAEPNEPA